MVAHTFSRYIRLGFVILTLILSPVAHATLPESSSVPGGVAVIPLGDIPAGAARPQAWLGDQPVLVTSDHNQWYAIVGIPLNMAPGSYDLSVNAGAETKPRQFVVNPKEYPEQHITLNDNSKVQLSAPDQARAEREIAIILELKRHWADAPETDLALVMPAEGKLGSRFGLRRFFNGEPRAPHGGLDVVVERDTPIRASAGGKVLATDEYFFNGKTVFIDHGNGLITMYCHLDRIDVKPGEGIGKGQVLGLAGKTGRATGTHLHWSVVLNGAMVDPALFVQPQHTQHARQ